MAIVIGDEREEAKHETKLNCLTKIEKEMFEVVGWGEGEVKDGAGFDYPLEIE